MSFLRSVCDEKSARDRAGPSDSPCVGMLAATTEKLRSWRCHRRYCGTESGSTVSASGSVGGIRRANCSSRTRSGWAMDKGRSSTPSTIE